MLDLNAMPKSTAPKNLWNLLQPALEQYSENPAWLCRERDGKRTVTYRQLRDAALTTADKLRERGLKDGDRVGIIAPNGAEFSIAMLAAWKIGANIAPIHIHNSAHEIAQQMQALAPQILLHYGVGDVPHGIGNTPQPAMAIDLQSEAARIAREIKQPSQPTADQLAVRIYTSGSTGNSKIVRLSHGNLISNVLAARNISDFTQQDRFISLLPLSHAMGLLGTLLLPLHHGCAMVSPRVLAAKEIMDTLQQENISVVIAVPRLFRNIMLGLEQKFKHGGLALTLYRALLKTAPLALRRRINAPLRNQLGRHIKVWVSGGSHLDARISRYYHNLGLPLRQGYGLTETSPLTSMQEEFDRAVDSVGKAVSQVRVKIHNPDASGNGEIWIKGPNVMLGYEEPSQTAAALHQGWFKSGDLGRLDARGRIFLSGRIKRLIVTEAGKNVYPEELETLLERDPTVKEAAVLEADTQPVCVLAMQDQDEEAAAEKTLAKFNQLVSSHNRITRFALVAELPRTALGKIALQELPSIFAKHEVRKARAALPKR